MGVVSGRDQNTNLFLHQSSGDSGLVAGAGDEDDEGRFVGISAMSPAK
jgi:hypothetical protein